MRLEPSVTSLDQYRDHRPHQLVVPICDLQFIDTAHVGQREDAGGALVRLDFPIVLTLAELT